MLKYMSYLSGWAKPQVQPPWLEKTREFYNHINMIFVNCNPKYAAYLKLHPDAIEWTYLCKNPSADAIEILSQNQEKINWTAICCNPSAIGLIGTNLDKVDWETLSFNAEAIHILTANMDKINWKTLSSNYAAIELLENNQDKISWDDISININAETLVYNNLDKINWHYLAFNPSGWAMSLLEHNYDKIDWDILSFNPHPQAIRLLNHNRDKINWNNLSANPGSGIIFNDGYIHNIHYGFLCLNTSVGQQFMEMVHETIDSYTARNDGENMESYLTYDYDKISRLKHHINSAVERYNWRPEMVAKFIKRRSVREFNENAYLEWLVNRHVV